VRALRAIAGWWDRFWFTPTTRYQYGVFRILFVGGLFAMHFGDWWMGDDLSARARTPAPFTAPNMLVRFLHLPLDVPGAGALQLVIFALVVLSVIGLGTRIALVTLALVSMYVNAVLNSFGFIDHATTVPSLVLLVLAFTPGATDLSLDAWRRARRQGGDASWRGPWTGIGRARAQWPAVLVLVLLSLSYFGAGWSKLNTTGLAWADGQTLQAYAEDPWPSPYFLTNPKAPGSAAQPDGTRLESFLYDTAEPTALARWLGQSGLLMAGIATIVLIWEVTFPSVLFARRLLPVYLGVGAVFHLSVWVLFSLRTFVAYILVYLLFVDWTAVHRWLVLRRRRLTGEGQLAGSRS